MAIDNEIKAVIGIGDMVRDTSENAIQKIKDMDVEIVMLTGDNEVVAEAIGKKMNIDTVHANLKPSDKCDEIKRLQQNGKVVGMIGDGINDAPALATADVSFAIGTATEIAMEAANITLDDEDNQAESFLGIRLQRHCNSFRRTRSSEPHDRSRSHGVQLCICSDKLSEIEEI